MQGKYKKANAFALALTIRIGQVLRDKKVKIPARRGRFALVHGFLLNCPDCCG